MHSRKTEILALPLYAPKDHPDFLTDWNEAMSVIDKYADGMQFITDQEFSDVVNKQVELIEDVKALKATDEDFKNQFEEVNGSISELDHRLMHEHERNDLQDGQIKNLREDIGNEIQRADGVETQLREDLEAEVTRATGAEENLNLLLNMEIERAENEEQSLMELISTEENRALEAENALNENINNEYERAVNRELEIELQVSEIDNKTKELETRLSTEHQTNDQQQALIDILENKVTEHSGSISQQHDDIQKLNEQIIENTSELDILSQNVSGINEQLATNTNDISAIESKIESGIFYDDTDIQNKIAKISKVIAIPHRWMSSSITYVSGQDWGTQLSSGAAPNNVYNLSLKFNISGITESYFNQLKEAYGNNISFCIQDQTILFSNAPVYFGWILLPETTFYNSGSFQITTNCVIVIVSTAGVIMREAIISGLEKITAKVTCIINPYYIKE